MSSPRAGNEIYHVDVPRVGAHRDPPIVREVVRGLGHRPRRSLSRHVIRQELLHHPGTFERGVPRHLEKRKLPLHEGKHPPLVEVGDDDGRGQPLASQALERIGVHLEPRLALEGRHPVWPSVRLLQQHLASVRREPPVIVAKVEPPAVPLAVVGCHFAGDVVILPRSPQLKCQAPRANGPPHPRRDVFGVELAPEEVPP